MILFYNLLLINNFYKIFLQLLPQEAIIFHCKIFAVKFHVTLDTKLVKIQFQKTLLQFINKKNQLTCDLNASESIPEPSELEPKYFHF